MNAAESKTIDKVSRLRCYGCTACQTVCPTGSITMVENDEGFLFPKIDYDTCVHCGKCVRTCPVEFEGETYEPEKALAGRTRDNHLYEVSSSGGVFAAIAMKFLSEGGNVFGASMGEGNVTRHICINRTNDLMLIQGSKYVQSDMGKCYSQVVELLQSGKRVLFSGTPCQIAGLNNVMEQGRIYRENLFTVDIVCHGVPSPKFFIEHIKHAYGDVSNVRFRHRSKYDMNLFAIGYEKNERYHIIMPTNKDSYYSCFSNQVSLREACYRCSYAQRSRPGDITLGDCGTHSLYENVLGFDKAFSIVLLNNARGVTLLNDTPGMDICPIDYDAETKANKQLSFPTPRPQLRDTFYKDLFIEGRYTEKNIALYLKRESAREKLKNGIVLVVPQSMRRKAKRVFSSLHN